MKNYVNDPKAEIALQSISSILSTGQITDLSVWMLVGWCSNTAVFKQEEELPPCSQVIFPLLTSFPSQFNLDSEALQSLSCLYGLLLPWKLILDYGSIPPSTFSAGCPICTVWDHQLNPDSLTAKYNTFLLSSQNTWWKKQQSDTTELSINHSPLGLQWHQSLQLFLSHHPPSVSFPEARHWSISNVCHGNNIEKWQSLWHLPPVSILQSVSGWHSWLLQPFLCW